MKIIETLKAFVSEELLDELPVEANDNLLSDGMVDSIGMVRLVAFIEEEYDLQIPHEDLIIENFRTIEIIGNYLSDRLK